MAILTRHLIISNSLNYGRNKLLMRIEKIYDNPCVFGLEQEMVQTSQIWSGMIDKDQDPNGFLIKLVRL
jgi:hypothetical protein